jgi:high affinity Mn2+ porin
VKAWIVTLMLIIPRWVLSEEVIAAENATTFHVQATSVTQGHYSFPSPYQGTNSLVPTEDAQTSITTTFFSGLLLGSFGEIYFNPELSAGSGISKTLGIAGYPNGEIYRVDNPNPVWNLARLYLKKVFNFGGGQEKIEDAKNQVATTYDINRLSVTIGKFALNDFIDNNSLSHDPRTQFLNWALMDYGAWDYAADTRGYSLGFALEWNQKDWTLRFASVLEAQSANQLSLDMNIGHAHGDNLEYEYRYNYHDQPGVMRVLVYDNHAYMGNYQQALSSGNPPNILSVRQYSEKYGFGFGLEQKFSTDLGFFSRLSWNDGKTESWAFTEIDQSVTAGVSWNPRIWQKYSDTLGGALILNDLSGPHRNYLSAGGYGFIIGDGQLNYSSEKILETYYLIHFSKEATITIDYQFIVSPAYNSDRGPVSIFAARLHYEI